MTFVLGLLGFAAFSAIVVPLAFYAVFHAEINEWYKLRQDTNALDFKWAAIQRTDRDDSFGSNTLPIIADTEIFTISHDQRRRAAFELIISVQNDRYFAPVANEFDHGLESILNHVSVGSPRRAINNFSEAVA